MEEKDRPRIVLAYILAVILGVLLLSQLHFEFAKISVDHPREIVFIDQVKKDSTWREKPSPTFIKRGIHEWLFGNREKRDSSLARIVDTVYIEVVKETKEIKTVPCDTVVMPLALELSDENLYHRLRQQAIDKYKNKPVIRYYVKPKDGRKVFSLMDWGYYIHERKSMGLDGHQSNVVYYGDDVKSDDLLLVVYTLLDEGVPVQAVLPSKYRNDWKARSIEIGTDTTLKSNSLVSFSELRKRFEK